NLKLHIKPLEIHNLKSITPNLMIPIIIVWIDEDQEEGVSVIEARQHVGQRFLKSNTIVSQFQLDLKITFFLFIIAEQFISLESFEHTWQDKPFQIKAKQTTCFMCQINHQILDHLYFFGKEIGSLGKKLEIIEYDTRIVYQERSFAWFQFISLESFEQTWQDLSKQLVLCLFSNRCQINHQILDHLYFFGKEIGSLGKKLEMIEYVTRIVYQKRSFACKKKANSVQHPFPFYY
ncbi:hypothetical protein ACJX0J_039314, partial [Zea mays]